eukprot:g19485.t1
MKLVLKRRKWVRGMVNVRSGPVAYKVWVGEAVLHKYEEHMKTAKGAGAKHPRPLKTAGRLSGHVGSHPPSSIKETLESEMDMADVTASTPLLPEEEDELLLRHSGHK